MRLKRTLQTVEDAAEAIRANVDGNSERVVSAIEDIADEFRAIRAVLTVCGCALTAVVIVRFLMDD